MNTFFMSEGLDVDFGDETKEKQVVHVMFGTLVGTLNTIETGKYTKLKFFTQDIASCFSDENKIVESFSLKFDKKIYEFPVKQYNYSLTPSGGGMLVKIEELENETE